MSLGICLRGVHFFNANSPLRGVLSSVVCLRPNVMFDSSGYKGIATKTIPPMKRPNRRPNRHRDENFRKARAAKVVKIDLQDFEFERRRYRDEVTPEEMKEKMAKFGIPPATRYREKPMYISSTGALIDEYVPPEGDGKASLMSTSGAKQMTDVVKGKGKTMMSIRKIRSYHDEFDPRDWVDEAEEIYIDAHNALADLDEDKLHTLVTEKCFPEMMYMAKRKTIRWKYIKSLEPPRVVHARHAEIVSKDNIFGQITVRFHSQQSLAIYDRFGRLIHGNENVVKDVLEYCVFEKHLSNVYGVWRLHSKIIPDWMPKSEDSGRLTYMAEKKADKPSKTRRKASADDKEETNKDEEGETLYDRFGKILKRN
eukprot:TRINITY_DN24182_c0_g1_i1.p1 TRINITY_DN24182_c0_g1~~TRINITY_DN24182_c0_g1_i1.p1  ORF type:complete len:368 (+),score=30.70 TRINITY_DN24182_c0_g1_i1:36-1139(+)